MNKSRRGQILAVAFAAGIVLDLVLACFLGWQIGIALTSIVLGCVFLVAASLNPR